MNFKTGKVKNTTILKTEIVLAATSIPRHFVKSFINQFIDKSQPHSALVFVLEDVYKLREDGDLRARMFKQQQLRLTLMYFQTIDEVSKQLAERRPR